MFDADDIAQRLETRFKLGTHPTLRRALYHRIGALVEAEGERAYLVVAEVAAQAAGKNDPGKYFAFVILRRLMERRILESPAL